MTKEKLRGIAFGLLVGRALVSSSSLSFFHAYYSLPEMGFHRMEEGKEVRMEKNFLRESNKKKPVCTSRVTRRETDGK